MKGQGSSPGEALLFSQERSFLLIGQTRGVGKLKVCRFSASVAEEFKEIGNWELFGGRQSIGSAMVLPSEKCTHMCRCVHTYAALPGNFSGLPS